MVMASNAVIGVIDYAVKPISASAELSVLVVSLEVQVKGLILFHKEILIGGFVLIRIRLSIRLTSVAAGGHLEIVDIFIIKVVKFIFTFCNLRPI
jgi:hypothetical protein